MDIQAVCVQWLKEQILYLGKQCKEWQWFDPDP